MRPLEERLAALPGVEAVGSVTNLPLAGQDGDVTFTVEGDPIPEPGQENAVWFRRITPDYFDAMSLELVAGREFTAADADDQPQVVISQPDLVRRLLRGRSRGEAHQCERPRRPQLAGDRGGGA